MPKISFKIFFGIFFVLLSALVIYTAKNKLVESGYFSIKKIIIKGIADIDPPREFLGKNLFTLRIKDLEKRLYFRYPQLRDLVIKRSFPDTLIITSHARIAVAKLSGLGSKQGTIFLIDKEGVLLDLPDASKYDKLPTIYGLSGKIKHLPKAGKIKNAALSIALIILQEYGKIEGFREKRIRCIDLSVPADAFFEIETEGETSLDKEKAKKPSKGVFKVIIGNEEARERMNVLRVLISKIKSNLDQIKYIDLRFKNPVTGAW